MDTEISDRKSSDGVGSSPGLARAENLRHRIYNDLRDRLRNGRIGPDDRIIDVKIARTLGVSRMPVREALLQLISEGHLVSTTRGFALPHLSAQDIRDIFEIRKLLEPRAAANAARDFDKVGLTTLGRALELARSAVANADAEELASANIQFRQAWLNANRNTRLAETIARFADQAQIVRRETLKDPEIWPLVMESLTGLYNAFARGDAIVAYDRMTAFIGEAEKSYYQTLPRRVDASADLSGAELNISGEGCR